MGTGGTPTIPLFIGQGANGHPEWTPGNKPGIGRGDGVMIAGDVRTLARTYCDHGTAVYYEQYDLLSHTSSVGIWLLKAIDWINDRFAGQPAPRTARRSLPAIRSTRSLFPRETDGGWIAQLADVVTRRSRPASA